MPYKDPDKNRQYQRERQARIRQEYLADKSCVQCDSTDRLEIDHVDPKQKISHRIWSWSATRRMAELAKCQVLCYSCHLEKTKEDRAPKQHGTPGMRKYCKCDACKEWERNYRRDYRSRNGR